jgi:hypothetical protein
MSEINDLLERFRRGPEVLAMVMTGSAGPESDFSTAPGKWNIRTMIRHLADTELVFAQRFRAMLAEDNPVLTVFDQDAWASKLDYAARKPADSLDHFRRLRADSHELLKSAPAEAFARTGQHPARGQVTIQDLMAICVKHVESHAQQIQHIREEFKKTKAAKA